MTMMTTPSRLRSRAGTPIALAVAIAAALVLAAGDAGAQAREGEACKSESISRVKTPDFATAFDAAEKRAKAWAADAAIARLTHTTLGPIDADARSANWYMVWFSPSANMMLAVTIANGTITCWGNKGSAGRMPQLKPDFYKDVKQLLATAAEKGGAPLLKDGYLPHVEMSAGARSQAYWYVNYEHPQKRNGLQVIFDANTGKFVMANK